MVDQWVWNLRVGGLNFPWPKFDFKKFIELRELTCHVTHCWLRSLSASIPSLVLRGLLNWAVSVLPLRLALLLLTSFLPSDVGAEYPTTCSSVMLTSWPFRAFTMITSRPAFCKIMRNLANYWANAFQYSVLLTLKLSSHNQMSSTETNIQMLSWERLP